MKWAWDVVEMCLRCVEHLDVALAFKNISKLLKCSQDTLAFKPHRKFEEQRLLACRFESFIA